MHGTDFTGPLLSKLVTAGEIIQPRCERSRLWIQLSQRFRKPGVCAYTCDRTVWTVTSINLLNCRGQFFVAGNSEGCTQ